MTDQKSDREKVLRSRAAEAFTYQRPDAAKRSIVDTTRLWDSTRKPSRSSEQPGDRPGKRDAAAE